MIDPQTQVTRLGVSSSNVCFLFFFIKGKVRECDHVQRSQQPAFIHWFQFQLGEVCQFAAHQENTRLMGFVVEDRDWGDGGEEGAPTFSAFVFESNTEGEKVQQMIECVN